MPTFMHWECNDRLAGEFASWEAKGPGSLRVCLLDQLYSLTEKEIWKGLKIKVLPGTEKRETW